MILTAEQQEIRNHSKGIALIQAGPGCGKTQTLIMFIKNILKSGVRPKQVLVLTYSKDTASDFKSRLKAEKIRGADHINVMTFHAFGNSVIKENLPLLGFDSAPKVKTENSSPNQLISLVATKHGVKHNDLTKAFYTHCYGNSTAKPAELKKALSELLKLHQKHKQNSGIIDFDDMQRLPLQLFNDPDILDGVAGRYSCLLVDELQDINGLQAKLLELLAPNIETTIMVGDKKQMIYGFRYAASKHWDSLIKRLKPQVFHLTETFRCPQNAIPMINAVAANICEDKPLVSNQKGLKPALYTFADVDEQADFLAKRIRQLIKKGIDLSDIACLSRINRTLESLKLALDARGIPCIESKANPEDVNVAFRIIRELLRITRWETNKKRYSAPEKAIRYIIKTLCIDGDRKQLVQQILKNGWTALKVPSKPDNEYRLVLNVKKAVIGAAQCTDIEQAVQIIIDSITPIINKRFQPFKRQILRELSGIKVAMSGTTWADLKISDIRVPTIASNEGVFLSTAHGSKGREWKCVFLIHVVEGEMPHHMSRNNEIKLQEERMLFYVAITRHSRRLYILQCPTTKAHFKNRGGHNKYKSEVFNGESSLITPIKKYLKIIP